MALTENGNGMIMPVQPMGGYGYGGMAYPVFGGYGGGYGGDWGSLIVLFLIATMFGGFGGGWGMNGFGGGLGIDFPWLMSGQQGINNNVSGGFRDAQLHDSITSVRDGVSSLATQLCNCCGDIAQQLCSGFAGVTASVTGAQNAIAQQLYTNQIADLNRSFDAQTAMTQGMNTIAMNQQNCCCENRAGIADLKYTVATENCADRAALNEGIRDIIAAQTAGFQSIKDQLCQDKIDAKNDEIAQLRQEVLFARGQASQVTQNQQIVDGIYNRLDTCPVGTTPVYGRTPIFTCNNNSCGCGCGNF